MSPDEAVERIAARLRDEGARRRFCERLVDAALDRPVRDLFDVDEALAVLEALAASPAWERWLADALIPAVDRHRDAEREAGERFEVLLGPQARAALEAWLDRVRPPALRWARGLVDPADAHELLSPVVQRTLVAFARRLPLGSVLDESAGWIGGLARGIRRGVEASGGRLVEVGRQVLGAELERRITTAARDFAAAALDEARVALVDRLRSAEGRAILRRMRARLLDGLARTPIADVLADLDLEPRAEMAAAGRRLLAVALMRPVLVASVRTELARIVDATAARPVRALLDEAGVLEPSRRAAVARLDAIVTSLVADGTLPRLLADWLAE
ncbi:MAG: hypothetical protein NZ898_14735 [Myxococcota bacterium]|nr:hypothetical protein [Myxococcota bacterium]MDW8361790.1 hypothetical protein [Myxococcales bacterium]